MPTTNEEIVRKIEALSDDMLARFDVLDTRFVRREEFEARMASSNLEIIRQVTPQLKALVSDAIHSAFREDFAPMLRETRRAERVERVDDIKDALKWPSRLAGYVSPVMQMILAAVAVWALFFR